MWSLILRRCLFILSLLALIPCSSFANTVTHIPILCYHNLNPTKPGSMNMTPAHFEAQMKWLKDNGFTVIPLKQAVAYLQGKITSLPNKAIVITADDGWESNYKYMMPIVKKYQIPVTLFIYPETISVGKNALTWDQLKEMQQTGLFDVQDHTYDHPNFKHAKKSMSPDAYAKYVTKQLVNSKNILDKKLNINVTLLAWPFGIYDAYLENAAAKAGYEMAFTIDAKTADPHFRAMAQPRYMIVTGLSEKTFQSIANSARVKEE